MLQAEVCGDAAGEVRALGADLLHWRPDQLRRVSPGQQSNSTAKSILETLPGRRQTRSSAMLQGWDKTYCLQFVEDDFDHIHFFGDKTYKVTAGSLTRGTERKL